jgi:hypothetical protein
MRFSGRLEALAEPGTAAAIRQTKPRAIADHDFIGAERDPDSDLGPRSL